MIQGMACKNAHNLHNKKDVPPRRKTRCVCQNPLWRRKDGKCVHQKDCGVQQKVPSKDSDVPKVDAGKLPPTTPELVGKERLIVTTNDVDFEVTDDGEVYIDIWMIYELKPTSNSPSMFPHTYLVQHVEHNCLLLKYDYSNNGPSYCLLWGLSRANVDNTTGCYRKLESSCAGVMYDLTEPDDPCEKLDEHEKKSSRKNKEGTRSR
ncbi:hypothetical protein MRX96_002935 [Rhipicephalus microplus]